MDGWVERLQAVVDGIATSVAVVRCGGKELQVSACNERFLRMAEGGRARPRRLPFALDDLIPSYARRELDQKISESLESLVAQEIEQAFDLREGTQWWRLSLQPFRRQQGDTVIQGVLITGIDITAKMQLTQQLEISTSRFRLVVDAAYDAIVTMDQQQCVTLFNHAAENLFGYSRDEVIGQPLVMLLPDRVQDVHQNYVRQFAQSPVRSRQMDERNLIHGKHRNGRLIPVEVAISKILVNGIMEFTAVIRDITDRVRLMELLQRQAETDELTGLFNRRAFGDLAQSLLPPKGPLSLLMIDVDHFKRVNDTYGHDRGDDVLRMLARTVAKGLREGDIFARLGGEEFAVVLPGATVTEAQAVAEKLRLTFEKQEIDGWTGPPIPFTISVGVTHCTEADRLIWPALKRADAALYAAKEGGRNQVVVG